MLQVNIETLKWYEDISRQKCEIHGELNINVNKLCNNLIKKISMHIKKKSFLFYLPAHIHRFESMQVDDQALVFIDLNKHLPALHELYLAWHQTT